MTRPTLATSSSSAKKQVSVASSTSKQKSSSPTRATQKCGTTSASTNGSQKWVRTNYYNSSTPAQQSSKKTQQDNASQTFYLSITVPSPGAVLWPSSARQREIAALSVSRRKNNTSTLGNTSATPALPIVQNTASTATNTESATSIEHEPSASSKILESTGVITVPEPAANTTTELAASIEHAPNTSTETWHCQSIEIL